MTWLVDAIRGWFRPSCRMCGEPKPLFSQVCDRCWLVLEEEGW